MLAEFLRKTRTLRRKGGGSRGVDSRKLDMVNELLSQLTDSQVIDTTLAKLLANSGDTPDLLSLLAGSNDCVSSELEPFLEQRPYVLVTVMRIQGNVERVLELLQRYVVRPCEADKVVLQRVIDLNHYALIRSGSLRRHWAR